MFYIIRDVQQFCFHEAEAFHMTRFVLGLTGSRKALQLMNGYKLNRQRTKEKNFNS
jgi:hypothetical protein